MGSYRYNIPGFCRPLAVLLLIWSAMSVSCSQQYPDSSYKNAYIFPVKPGTKEWRTLSGHEEMVRVCQIPTGILRKISTAALVETVLNYPLYWTTIISNSAGTQQGFNVLASQFNGIQELLRRGDAGGELLMKYRSIPPPKKTATDTEIGDYLFYNYSIEILFAQGVIRFWLTETQLEEFKKELLTKYEIKKKLKEDKGLSKEIMALLAPQYNLSDKIKF